MIELDPLDVRRARHAPGLLREFNDAGVLSAADVHVAVRLCALAGDEDEWVTLAAEMQRSHYVLQALLYAVALHRFLRWRLPGYVAGRHLSGVAWPLIPRTNR